MRLCPGRIADSLLRGGATDGRVLVDQRRLPSVYGGALGWVFDGGSRGGGGWLPLQVGGGDPALSLPHLHIPPATRVLGDHGHGTAGRETESVPSVGRLEVCYGHVHLLLWLADDLIHWTGLISGGGGGGGLQTLDFPL